MKMEKLLVLIAVVVMMVISFSGTATAQGINERFKNILVEGTATFVNAASFEGGSTFDGSTTFSDDVTIDGSADEVQLTVQGNSTQTSNVFEVENSAGTAKAVIDNDGLGTFAGGVYLSGDGTGWLTLGAQTAISMTAGAPITPTGTFQPLESAAAVTSSATTAIISGTNSGELLILQNTNASDALIIDGTGANVECKANVTLAAGDTLSLIWDGANWVCISGYDNS